MKVRTFGFIAVVLAWAFAGGAFATTDTALQFDGSNDYVVIPDSDTLSPQTTGAMTLSAWVNVSSLPTTQPFTILAKGMDYNWEYCLALQPQPNSAQVILWRPTGSAYAHIEAGTVSLNQWHNITSTYNGSMAKLYVDGALVGQTDSFNPPLGGNGTGNLFIGEEDSSDHTWNFKGAIDDVSIWNVAMTDAQVQQLYNTPLLTGSESGLAAYWNFNEGSGQVVNDVTGHGNNGVLGSTTGADASDPTWVAGVPEPATMALLAFGGIFLRRRNTK